MNLTVEAHPGAAIEFTTQLKHRCPFRDELDYGTVTISWTTVTHTLELHALAEWLRGFVNDVISHEDITTNIAEVLGALEGVASVAVSTGWTTAGGRVVVRSALPGERVVSPGA